MEVMMWGYMENVKSYFSAQLYEKYGRIFGSIWIASAYKGAMGELAYLTSIHHHYINHISWIEVMREKIKNNVVKFKGIAFTGWSRYDHFLVLCDLLPQAIPSLVYCMQTMQYGELNEEKKSQIQSSILGCNNQVPWWNSWPHPVSLQDLYNLPNKCNFPGHELYTIVIRLDQTIQNVKPNLEFADKYLSDFQLNNNYIHKSRSLEVKSKLLGDYQSLNAFRKKFIQASQPIYNDDTIVEWLDVYFMPHFQKLYFKLSSLEKAYKENDWKPRPLPLILKQYPDFLHQNIQREFKIKR